jgi:hypothetical protein
VDDASRVAARPNGTVSSLELAPLQLTAEALLHLMRECLRDNEGQPLVRGVFARVAAIWQGKQQVAAQRGMSRGAQTLPNGNCSNDGVVKPNGAVHYCLYFAKNGTCRFGNHPAYATLLSKVAKGEADAVKVKARIDGELLTKGRPRAVAPTKA